MTKEEKLYNLLLDATKNLDPSEPIDESDPRYVDCNAFRGEEGRVFKQIEMMILKAQQTDAKPKTYLFCGHNGSGKSTELKTLQKRLIDKKLFTIKIDAKEVLDLEDPNYIDILFSIASEIFRQMEENHMPLSGKSMKTIEDWFNETILEKECEKGVSGEIGAGVETESSIPFVGKIFAKLMGQIKYSNNERKTIRKKIEPTVSHLMNHINKMITEAKKIIVEKGYIGFVIVYDNLEKMKLAYPEGTGGIYGRSTHEIIFIDNAHHFTGIQCHKIFTVPLALRYSSNNTRLSQIYDKTYVLPMIKVFDKETRKRCPEGINILFQVAQKRMDIDRIFENHGLVEEIALFSGGNVRDFIRHLENIVVPKKAEDIPLTDRDIQFAFRQTIREYTTTPSDNDFELLAHVYKTFTISNDPAHYLLLDNHSILAYSNGDVWYDVHPALQKVPKFQAAVERLNKQDNQH